MINLLVADFDRFAELPLGRLRHCDEFWLGFSENGKTLKPPWRIIPM
jgi:hypothetical protein